MPNRLLENITPEHMRLYPKAGDRKQSNKGKRKRVTAILTDTPVKNSLELEQNASKMKKTKKTPPTKRQKTVTQKTKKMEKTEVMMRKFFVFIACLRLRAANPVSRGYSALNVICGLMKNVLEG